MSKSKVIVFKDNFSAVRKQITGDGLLKAARGGGRVIQSYAMINAERVFSANSKQELAGSIQVVDSKSTPKYAEVDVGPTVIYGRIRELGGMIRPIHAKKLAWPLGGGGGGKQKAGGKIFVSDGKVFADFLQVTPTPYLRPAVDEHEKEISQAVGHQLRKQIEDVT